MAGIGPPEILIVLLVVMLLFGASRLPGLARSMGQASKEFRAGISEGEMRSEAVLPCSSCGAEVPRSARFCPTCSNPIQMPAVQAS